MSDDDDLDYLQRRAEKELEMAQRSETPEVTAAHYKLAEAYLERVEVLRASAAAEPGEPGGEAAADAEAAAAGLPEGREAVPGARAEQ
ncbi:hypothetical protein [Blastomonas sp.]|uniref:hypothetical protein n=1 Tax=Alphaproteobacteria TaxID=28211 RepID=UPI0026345242|nr:hypothetical protein [Blastomonas sp.]MDM7957982.1 hypothetical protein [Blastomonas sp.]